MQFIDSVSIAEVMEKHDSILNYLKKFSPAENNPLGVAPEVIDNYVKSCGKCGPGRVMLDNWLPGLNPDRGGRPIT